jgi:hypothetical protein
VLIVTLSGYLLFIHPRSSAIQHCVIDPVDTAQSNSQCIDCISFEFTPADTRFMKIEMLLMFPETEIHQTHPHLKATTRARN